MATRPPMIAAEKETAHAFLDLQRDTMLWKLDGLDDEALRRPLVPTGTNLLGMVKHLALVEYGWFCETFGRETGPVPFDDDEDDGDAHMRVGPDDATQDVLAFYAAARDDADSTIRELDLDDTGTAWTGDEVTLRWVLLHMIEETARHVGHADILRELLDGETGYRPPDYLPR